MSAVHSRAALLLAFCIAIAMSSAAADTPYLPMQPDPPGVWHTVTMTTPICTAPAGTLRCALETHMACFRRGGEELCSHEHRINTLTGDELRPWTEDFSYNVSKVKIATRTRKVDSFAKYHGQAEWKKGDVFIFLSKEKDDLSDYNETIFIYRTRGHEWVFVESFISRDPGDPSLNP